MGRKLECGIFTIVNVVSMVKAARLKQPLRSADFVHQVEDRKRQKAIASVRDQLIDIAAAAANVT